MAARRRRVAILVAAVCLASHPQTAQSANLSLFTGASPGNPLVLTPLDATNQLLVSVANDTAVDPPELRVTAWQLRIRSVPDPGTSGVLEIAGGAEPENYLFAAVSHPFGPTGAPLPGNPTVFTAFDLVVPTNVGVQVPPAPGANLFQVSFSPSFDARGRFGIYALNRGDDTTQWADTNSPNNQPHDFVNVPRDGPPVRIADVLVTSVADYNRNGVVDAADYTVWRDALGQSGDGLAADGDGDAMITELDYGVWKLRFGQRAEIAPGSASYLAPGESPGANYAVPEPSAWLLAIAAAYLIAAQHFAAPHRGGIPARGRQY